MPSRSLRLVLAVWVGALAFASFVTFGQLATLGFERSPFVLMTSPYAPDPHHISNPFFGYAMAADDGDVLRHGMLHKENTAAALLARKLVGGDSSVSFYDGRMMLPFAVSSLLWLAGSFNAALLVNALLWSAAILAGFLFGRDLSRTDGGGFVCAGLVALGFGYWFHVLDLSAHLAAFSTYAVGAYAIFRSNVWRERAGWKVHAVLAAILAVACATYNSGIMLLAVYIAVSVLGRNKVFVVGLAAAAALAFQYGWLPLMNAFGSDPAPITTLEQRYLGGSLELWISDFRDDAGQATARTFTTLGQFLFAEPATLLGFLALAILYVVARSFKAVPAKIDWRLVAFLAVLIATPALASLPWSRIATARGYVAYPASIAIYAATAGLLVILLRAARPWRWAAIAAVGLTAALQTALLASVMSGNIAPLKTYFVGGNLNPEYVAHLIVPAPLEVIPLGGGAIPKAAGGSLDFGESMPDSLLGPMGSPPSFSSLPRTAAWRSYVALPLLLLVLAWTLTQRGRLRWAAPAAAAAVLIALPILASPITRASEVFRGAYFDSTVDASQANSVRYDIALSEQAASALRDLARRGAAVEFAFREPAGASAGVWLGENRIATNALVRTEALRFANVSAGDVLSLRYEREDAPIGWLPGYRRSGTPGHSLAVDGVEDPPLPFLPFLEIRGFRQMEGGWPLFVAL